MPDASVRYEKGEIERKERENVEKKRKRGETREQKPKKMDRKILESLDDWEDRTNAAHRYNAY